MLYAMDKTHFGTCLVFVCFCLQPELLVSVVKRLIETKLVTDTISQGDTKFMVRTVNILHLEIMLCFQKQSNLYY